MAGENFVAKTCLAFSTMLKLPFDGVALTIPLVADLLSFVKNCAHRSG
jgi:hypothetical protein